MSVHSKKPMGKPVEKPIAMFMDTFQVDAAKDLVEVGLMECGPDGFRPDVDGATMRITLPLSQFGPLLDEMAAAIRRIPAG